MKTVKSYSGYYKYWWLMLVIGILSVICGIIVFRYPVASYYTLAVYFSILFLIYGAAQIVNAISYRKYKNWGWTLAIGILNVIIGILLVSNFAWTASLLPFFVGFMLLFIGIDFIGWSMYLNSQKVANWGWVLAGGILTVIFSFLIIFFPLFGVLNIIVWTGLAFLFGGISAIIYAFGMRKCRDGSCEDNYIDHEDNSVDPVKDTLI